MFTFTKEHLDNVIFDLILAFAWVHKLLNNDRLEELGVEGNLHLLQEHILELLILKVPVTVCISRREQVDQELPRLLQAILHHKDHDCFDSVVDFLDKLIDLECGRSAIRRLFGQISEDLVDFFIVDLKVSTP